MSLKSFLCTMAIFCGGYAFSTILDEVVDAGEKYFRVQTSTYKTDSDGYIICSPEKPTISNADFWHLINADKVFGTHRSRARCCGTTFRPDPGPNSP